MRKRDVYAYWSCWRKTTYSTRDDAEAPGFRVYKCRYCRGFHRATDKDRKRT